MFPLVIPNISTSLSDEASNTSGARVRDFGSLNSMLQNRNVVVPAPKTKKKRNLPGNPDPDAEVIALSPKTLMAANRFVCEICNKGFQRDQNLQLHRRGHNLPWKLKQRNSKENRKRAYVCPEPTCLHHHPSRALGDLTGIKKHFCRKHGEKKWKCDKCSKIYAVQSDWKAHSKTCGTREYRCDCGTLFSRKDSFITHRAFCDALAEESARLSAATNSIMPPNPSFTTTPTPTPIPIPTTTQPPYLFNSQNLNIAPSSLLPFSSPNRHFRNQWEQNPNPNLSHGENQVHHMKHDSLQINPLSSPLYQDRSLFSSPFGDFQVSTPLPPLSATALLQKAATIGASVGGHVGSAMAHLDMHAASPWQKTSDGLTRDFLGLASEHCGDNAGGSSSDNGNGNGNGNLRELLPPFTGGVKFSAYERDRNALLKQHGFGYTETFSGWSNC